MSAQSGLQQRFREVAGTAYDWNGDMIAASRLLTGVSDGDANAHLFRLVNEATGSTAEDLPGQLAAYATMFGAVNWSSCGYDQWPAQWGPPEGSSASWDFMTGRHFHGTQLLSEAEAFTITRASNGPLFLDSGDYATLIEHNTPRYDHVAYQGDPLGLRYEPVGEGYYWINSVLTGAAVGVDGVSGSLPTLWAEDDVAARGGAITIDEIGTSFAVPFIALTIDVTNGTGSNIFPGIRLANIAGAAQGDNWTTAGWFGLTSLSGDSAINTQLHLQERVDGTYADHSAVNIVNDPFGVRQSVGRPFIYNVNQAHVYVTHTLPAGQRLHRQIRIMFPTLTKSAVLSTPLASSDLQALRTRAAETLTLTLPAGTHDLEFLFDNDTTQTITGATGNFVVPALNRTAIKRIVATAA